jgi:hypothetical protein
MCLRTRRADSEVPFRVYGRGNDSAANANNDIAQFYGDNAGLDNLVARLTALGNMWARNNDITAWTDIVINSPTTAGKYSAGVNGTNNRNAPQVCIVDGGRTAKLRGVILIANVAGVTDELVSSTAALPTAVASAVGLSGTYSAVPVRERSFPVFFTGAGAQRFRVNSNGSLQIVGTSPTGGTGAFLSLDGQSYSLES